MKNIPTPPPTNVVYSSIEDKKVYMSGHPGNGISQVMFRNWIKKATRPIKLATKSVKQKVGRNDPCPCGSEKKFKYCCINK